MCKWFFYFTCFIKGWALGKLTGFEDDFTCVVCQSIPWIDTSNQHLEQHTIRYLADTINTLLTAGRVSTNSHTLIKNGSAVDQDVNGV